MAILVENGGHGGTTAAPIAREVFDYYLLGKKPDREAEAGRRGRRTVISRLFDLLSRRIDGPLMAALVLTIALGLTVVYSASGGGSRSTAWSARGATSPWRSRALWIVRATSSRSC